MSSLNVNMNNCITFKRMKSINVLAYNIYKKVISAADPNGKELIAVIQNPKEPQLSQYSLILNYTKSQIFKLPDDVYTDMDHTVEVFLNDIKIDNQYKTYSDKLKTLTIVKKLPLKETDKIEVKFYKDIIKYVHNTTDNCEYIVEPIIEVTHNMGTHNVIK